MNKCQTIQIHEMPGIVAGTCNLKSKEAETGRSRLQCQGTYQESVSKKLLNQVPEVHTSNPSSLGG
jgi:hypothetical protein